MLNGGGVDEVGEKGWGDWGGEVMRGIVLPGVREGEKVGLERGVVGWVGGEVGMAFVDVSAEDVGIGATAAGVVDVAAAADVAGVVAGGVEVGALVVAPARSAVEEAAAGLVTAAEFAGALVI